MTENNTSLQIRGNIDSSDCSVILTPQTPNAHDISNQEIDFKNKDTIYKDTEEQQQEEAQISENAFDEESDDDSEYTGYISVRDFAYDAENPLHYGYLDEDEEDEQEYIISEDDDNYSGEYSDKRKSYSLPREYIINKEGIALYDFENLNDNELPLKKGDLIFINYKHGQGWLVVQRLDDSGEAGLVPEDYVEIIEDEFSEHTENTAEALAEQNIVTQDMSALNIQD